MEPRSSMRNESQLQSENNAAMQAQLRKNAVSQNPRGIREVYVDAREMGPQQKELAR